MRTAHPPERADEPGRGLPREFWVLHHPASVGADRRESAPASVIPAPQGAERWASGEAVAAVEARERVLTAAVPVSSERRQRPAREPVEAGVEARQPGEATVLPGMPARRERASAEGLPPVESARVSEGPPRQPGAVLPAEPAAEPPDGQPEGRQAPGRETALVSQGPSEQAREPASPEVSRPEAEPRQAARREERSDWAQESESHEQSCAWGSEWMGRGAPWGGSGLRGGAQRAAPAVCARRAGPAVPNAPSEWIYQSARRTDEWGRPCSQPLSLRRARQRGTALRPAPGRPRTP